MQFTPVQMIGTQRSGSNLLRLMLNQLPEVSAPHPPHILERFMPLLPAYGDLFVPANFKSLVEDVCKLVTYNPVPWQDLTLHPDVIAERCAVPALTEIARVVYELKAASEGAHIWMCKSMANIHFAHQLEASVKPLYLFLYRDGRDVACSFKKAVVGEKHVYHIAKQWKFEQDLCLALQQQLSNEKVMAVCYEKVLANPEKELRNICTFIGADYRPECLQYYHSKEAKTTASSGIMWQNVEHGILASNYNKYRRGLTTNEIMLFEKVAGYTLSALGYTLEYPGIAEEDCMPEEIEIYNILNRQLKQQAKQMQKPEDAEKRRMQDTFLHSIQIRFANMLLNNV